RGWRVRVGEGRQRWAGVAAEQGFAQGGFGGEQAAVRHGSRIVPIRLEVQWARPLESLRLTAAGEFA
nr:hypothetical protein [Thermoanaerobaculia bacterium]